MRTCSTPILSRPCSPCVMSRRTHRADAVDTNAGPDPNCEGSEPRFLPLLAVGTGRSERHATVETMQYLRTFCRVAVGRRALLEVFQVVGWGREYPWSSFGLAILLVEVRRGHGKSCQCWPTNTRNPGGPWAERASGLLTTSRTRSVEVQTIEGLVIAGRGQPGPTCCTGLGLPEAAYWPSRRPRTLIKGSYGRPL
jgi:hypothetical protein